MDERHGSYMQKCLGLAIEARRNGKTGVGAIVVRNDQVVSEGIEGDDHLPALLSHAEILAIIRAVDVLGTRDLSDCKLYTSVEPCIMCSYLIRVTGIREVIYGVNAGTAGGASSNYKILGAEDIAKWGKAPLLVAGVMEDACKSAM